MIKWIALAAVLLALIGGVVWAATVNSGDWCANDAIHGGCHVAAGDCPQAADAPATCHSGGQRGHHGTH